MLFSGGELSSSLLNGSWTFPSRQTLGSISLSAPLPRRVWAEAEVGGRASAKIQPLVRECVCFRPIIKPFVVSCQSTHAQSSQPLPALSQHFAWYLPEFLRISSSLLMWVISLYGTQYHWVCYSFSAAVCHWQRWWLSLCVWPQSVMSHPPRPGEALSQCGSCGSSQTRQSSSYLQGSGVTASFMRWHCLVLADLTSLSPPSV